MTWSPRAPGRTQRERILHLVASFVVLAIAAMLIVVLPPGVFPPGAVILSALVAAALLAPADALAVAGADITAGILLAHYSSHYSGSALMWRSAFYVTGGALAFSLAVIRTSRDIEIARREKLVELHEFTSALFAQAEIDGIVDIVGRVGAALLDAHTVRVLAAVDDQLVLLGPTNATGATADGVVATSAPSAATTAISENVPMFFDDIDAYGARFPQWRHAVETAGGNAVAVVPLVSAGPPVGVLVVFYDQPRMFSDDDRLTIRQAAHEIGAALERAQLRERERSIAVKLQDSLLGPPIMVEGVGHEARYLPAEAELHVGGDWYNAQRLADGRVGIAVGDVVGRGLDAATVMGQLRSALSAYADQASTPAETVEQLDTFARQVPGAESASVVFARVDVWGRTIEYSLAGHPPPVLVSPTGEVDILDDAIGRPLAVMGTSPGPRPTGARPFPPGSVVILYSDGLIERRRESLDVGIERLARVVREHWNLPLQHLCDEIVRATLGGRSRTDDVALIALRSPASTDRVFLTKQRASASGLATIRAALREWLHGVDVDGEDAYAVLVAVGEAATNAVEHAYSDAQGLVRVEAAYTDGEIICCVSDTGRWHDHAARDARGNGLPIMRELMHSVEIARRPTGTSITLRYRPTREPRVVLVDA